MNFGKKVIVSIGVVYGLSVYIGTRPDHDLATMAVWMIPVWCILLVLMIDVVRWRPATRK